MERLKKYHQQLNIMGTLLEDDTDILEVLEVVFKENGFENFRFFDKATAMIESFDTNVHICIIDYFLPGTNGIEVLNKVRDINPDCWFIGFTGLAERRLLLDMVNAGCKRMVDKNEPDFINKLISFVQEAIDYIKKDFDWHSNILKRIETYEAKLAL